MKTFAAFMLCILSSNVTNAQPGLGDMAPEISLQNKADSMVHLSSFRGKLVLIDFWASWCAPCRAANPVIGKLYKKYRSKGFEVFAVSIDEKKTAWLKAVAQDRVRYTSLIDPAGWNATIAGKYCVDQIPKSFLLDRTGRIIAIDPGRIELEKILKRLL